MTASAFITVSTLAAENNDQGGTAWWQVATGIIGIPAAVLGLVLTWSLIKKARVETAQAELDIAQKQAAVQGVVASSTAGDSTATAQIIAEPILEGRRIQQLVLRFIVLFVFFLGWTLVRDAFAVIYSGTRLGLAATVDDASGDSPIVIIAIVLLTLVRAVPEVGYSLIVVGFGWPLLLDALRLLNIGVRPWLRSPGTQRVLIAAAFVLPVLEQLGELGLD